MYGVVKNVINSKRYELAEMLKKIDTLWVQGSITDEQRTELVSLAQGNARAENSVDLFRMFVELDKRVTALESAKAPAEDETVGDESEGGLTEEVITYPEFEVGKWYYNGDKISFNGSNYVCIAPEGAVCVWSPADYPAYWGLVVEESEGTTEETEATE